MVFAVMAVLGFRNAARRDNVMGNVQTRLAAEVPWGVTTVEASASADAAGQTVTNAMLVEVRFETAALADAFVVDVLAAIGSGVNGPVTGSVMTRHGCRHDEGGACDPPVIVGSW